MERFTNAAFSFEVTDTPAAGGDGQKGVAILLHGFPQDRRCWDRVTSALAAGGYRVLAPDLRGYSRAAAELCGRYVTWPYRFTELHGASHWLPEQAAGQVAALLAEHFAATP